MAISKGPVPPKPVLGPAPIRRTSRWRPVGKVIIILCLPFILLFVGILVSVVYHRTTTPAAQLEMEDARDAQERARADAREKDAAEATRKQEEAAQKQKETPVFGTPIEVGDFSYTINDVKWKDVLGEGSLIQHPDAAFLVVDITVVNTGRKAYYQESPQLVDSSGRTYSSTSNAFIEEGSELWLKEFNPQVQSRGRLVFDVPYGSYSLRLSGKEDGLFHSPKTVPVVIYR